jgi:hypothetical protein
MIVRGRKPAWRIFSAPTTASGRFEARMATSSVALLLDQANAHRQVLGNAVERHPGEQREAHAEPGGLLSLGVPIKPGVDDDEGGGACKKSNSGQPRTSLLEGVLEELECHCCDQSARGEREQSGGHGSRRRAPGADPTTERQRARSDQREEDRLADPVTLTRLRLRGLKLACSRHGHPRADRLRRFGGVGRRGASRRRAVR